MRTVTGLNVPEGYGGSGKTVLKGALRSASSGRAVRSVPPRDRRHVNAEDAYAGLRLRGNSGKYTYEVLNVMYDVSIDKFTLLVRNETTGAVRTWVRRATFGLELA